MSDTSSSTTAAASADTVRFAIIGCGYVADFYMETIANYPHVKVVRAFDIEPAHAARYTAFWNVPSVTTAAAFFDGLDADVILNLTNPDSHYPVSRDCLERGFNVYSEKPLAMTVDQVFALRDLAQARGLGLASAPCNHLSEAVAGIRATLETGTVGAPLLVYAEMDDGFIARSPYRKWINPSGAPWPYEDEFEVGCTIEHAGYYLTWLIALFGSVRQVHAFSSLRYPGKPVGHKPEAADFSVACLTFESGLVARLTCGVVAPRDHRFTVFGEEGLMTAEDCWFYNTPVRFQRWIQIRRRFMLTPWKTRVALPPAPVTLGKRSAAMMDFARGPLDLVQARRAGRPSRVPLDFCVHFNEVSLAIHESRSRSDVYEVQSRCDSMVPVAISTDPATKRISRVEKHLLPMLGRL